MAKYVEDILQKDPIQMFTEDYTIRHLQDLNQETKPLIYAVMTTRLISQIAIHLLGLPVEAIEVLSIKGDCWICFLFNTENG